MVYIKAKLLAYAVSVWILVDREMQMASMLAMAAICLLLIPASVHASSLPHLHRKVSFYVHRNAAGGSSSSNSSSNFGVVSVIDEPIRVTRSNDSLCIGRLQGFSLADTPDGSSTLYYLTSNFNTTFLKGGLLFQGRVFPGTRNLEISVMGTSGIFRFARGYSLMYMGLEDNVDYVEAYLYKF